jgi:hypothetical protein
MWADEDSVARGTHVLQRRQKAAMDGLRRVEQSPVEVGENSLNLHLCLKHSRDVSTRPRDARASLNMTGG